MATNDIKVGILAKLQEALPDLPVFHQRNAPHEEVFPQVSYDLVGVRQRDYMDAPADPVATLMVAVLSPIDDGSFALREIEETIHIALHKQLFNAEGYEEIGTWCRERRDAEVLPDTNMYACMSVYDVFGSEDA